MCPNLVLALIAPAETLNASRRNTLFRPVTAPLQSSSIHDVSAPLTNACSKLDYPVLHDAIWRRARLINN
jgi:hypothetical protein